VIASRSGSISPKKSAIGPGRENQPSIIQVVSPSLKTSVDVPVQRTVTAPSGTADVGVASQDGSTGVGS
jgi:hypothetical protein